MLIRRVARPMLSAVFIGRGVDALRSPKPAADAARPTLDGLSKLPDPVGPNVPTDAETVAKVTAAVQIGGGSAAGDGQAAAVRLGDARPQRGAGKPRRPRFLERGRARPQGRRAARVPHRHQPHRRPDHCRGRHRGQAVARLARPPGRTQGLRRGHLRTASGCGGGQFAHRQRARRRSGTACTSAPSAAGSSRTSPVSVAPNSLRSRANAAPSGPTWPASVARNRRGGEQARLGTRRRRQQAGCRTGRCGEQAQRRTRRGGAGTWIRLGGARPRSRCGMGRRRARPRPRARRRGGQAPRRRRRRLADAARDRAADVAATTRKELKKTRKELNKQQKRLR